VRTTAKTAGEDRAILWDNDGVLVDTEKVFFEANRRELATLGVEASWADFEEFSLRRGESLLSLSGLDGDDLRALFARRDAVYSELLSTEEIAIAGMGELLGRLAPRFRMGIVTSSHREHFEIIHARSGLLRHFEFHVVREDYPLGKPHPDAYLAGIDRTGLPPDRCLAVEDSPRGVAAAQAAGLEVVLFAPGGVGVDREVGSVLSRVESADELEEALDDWAGR
jgi:HAD superfamily hydrolase (TIGR01509 family)